MPTAADATKEAIAHKTIFHDGTSDEWDYDLANHVVTNPDLSTLTQLEHSAFEGKAGLAYRTTQSDKVMIERQWALMKFTGSNDESASGRVTFNPVVTAEYTTLLEGGAQVKMSARQFLYDFNGNLTQIADYDWFDPAQVNRDEKGVPTGVPLSATLLRTTTNSYHNQATLPGGSTVYANRTIGSPPAPLILNAVKQTTTGPAQTRLSYDGLPFGSAPIKGNVTKVGRWESTK